MLDPSGQPFRGTRRVLLIGVVASVLVLGMMVGQQQGTGEISTLSDGHHSKGHARKIAGRKEKLHLAPQTLAVVKDQKVVDSLAAKLQKAQEKLGSMVMRQLAEMKKESLESKTSKLSQQDKALAAKVSTPSCIRRVRRV
jgi:hypothetical protein